MLLFRLINKEINLITKLVKAISVDYYMMLISELTHLNGVDYEDGGIRSETSLIRLIENTIIALILKGKLDQKL